MDHWGKFDVEKWRDLPCIKGRVAVEQDVIDGRAVFFIPPGVRLSTSTSHSVHYWYPMIRR